MIDKEFKEIFNNIKHDIIGTRNNVIENANKELLNLYFRLGKVIDENAQYGNNFINQLSIELKLEFPDMKGLSPRNLSRMRVFYREYCDLSILPVPLAKLPWTHNYTLIEKVKDKEKRLWYAVKCLENGWSQTVLIHQIESNLYLRQRENLKLTNLKERFIEKDIEDAMVSRIKNVLLELGKGFSFVGNQYKISTEDNEILLPVVVKLLWTLYNILITKINLYIYINDDFYGGEE